MDQLPRSPVSAGRLEREEVVWKGVAPTALTDHAATEDGREGERHRVAPGALDVTRVPVRVGVDGVLLVKAPRDGTAHELHVTPTLPAASC